MIRIDWINVAFVVIIVGGLLLIAATAQGAPRCPGVGSRTPRVGACAGASRQRVRVAVSTAADESPARRLQPAGAESRRRAEGAVSRGETWKSPKSETM